MKETEHNKRLLRREKKKRNRKEKKKLFALKQTVVEEKQYENRGRDSDEDEDGLDDEDQQDDYQSDDDESNNNQPNKIPRIEDNEVLFSRFFPQLEQLENLSEYSFQQILELKDIVDVTATEKGSLLLAKIIQPMTLENFYDKYWTKTPVVLTNDANKEGMKKFITKKLFKQILGENSLTINEDIFVVENNSSDLVNDSIKSSQDLFKLLTKGKALFLAQPQKFVDQIWKLFSCLEFEFNCRVDGAAVYQPENHSYTNPTFDADRFILQLEGTSTIQHSKHPQTLEQFLSNESSENSGDEEEGSSEPVTLGQFDILYVPQSIPVRIQSSSDSPSLQLIISTNRKNSIADLMHFTLPVALENIKSQSSFLKLNIPNDISSYLGIASSEKDDDHRRNAFQNILRKELDNLVNEVVNILDPAVDQNLKNFIMERLPVPLTPSEEAISYQGFANAVIYPYTQLRMVRPGIAIAVVEEGKVVVYHCMDNAREMFGNAINPLEFELDDGPAIEALLSAYPEPVTVSDLEHSSEELDDKVSIAQALYKEGILLIADPASQPADYHPEGADESDEDGFL